MENQPRNYLLFEYKLWFPDGGLIDKDKLKFISLK